MGSLKLLRCPVQTYHWGKTGQKSLVGRLARRGGHVADIDESTHYAELWMGTHPSKPSLLHDGGQTLSQFLNEKELSFLFKVLSVETALSIQAHPNKRMALELRAADPDHYPDSNHKPEIAIALTDFEALCCFRTFDEIDRFITGVPELREIVGCRRVSNKDDLRKAFRKLMESKSEVFEPQLQKLVARLAQPDASGCVPESLRDVLLRVAKQYPSDIGVFNMFFLNLVVLKPGEALFLAANEPHAYLSGDCVECMATSDNVVRAGLTPKYKDVNTLVNMLTYEPTKDPRFKADVVDDKVARFKPRVEDFAVMRFRLEDSDGPRRLQRTTASGSICIVIEGTGKLAEADGDQVELHEGSVVFVPAGTDVSVCGHLLLFQAYTP